MDRKPFQHRTKAFLLIDGLLVGIMSGSLVVLYRYILGKMDEWRHLLYEGTNLIQLLFLIGLAILSAFLVRKLLDWAPFKRRIGDSTGSRRNTGNFSHESSPDCPFKDNRRKPCYIDRACFGKRRTLYTNRRCYGKISIKRDEKGFNERKASHNCGSCSGTLCCLQCTFSGGIILH